MRLLSLAGSLPATILENTPAWEWTGVLRLLSNPAEVRFVEITGLAGSFFDARLDRMTGLIEITPSARLDAEAFRQAGRSFDLPIELRFFLTDGTQAGASSIPIVRLVDVDDTPPQGLSFASGGSVRAGQPGATIGRLQVSDPDTTGGFTFRLLEGDAWQLEVVGDELRLRPGVTIDLADGPRRPLIIEVSDGSQSAAFTLPIEVLPDPAVSAQPINLLLPGMSKAGFGWVDSSGVRGFVPEWEIAAIERGGPKVAITTKRGETVWFEKPQIYVDFGSGFLDFRTNGEAARLWLAFQTVLDRSPNLAETRLVVGEMLRGATDFHVVNWLLNAHAEGVSLQRLTNREFVTELYENMQGRPPSTTVLNNQTARLDAGVVDRNALVRQLMDFRTRFEDFQEAAAQGFYTPRRHMIEIGAGLAVGGNYPFLQEAWTWSALFDSGGWSIRGFANAVLNTEPGRAKWGGVSDRDFVDRVIREAFGTSFESFAPGALDWWADQLARGMATRGEFFGNVLQSLAGPSAADSPFRTLPTGTFDAIW
jgi:hypothetical protein